MAPSRKAQSARTQKGNTTKKTMAAAQSRKKAATKLSTKKATLRNSLGSPGRHVSIEEEDDEGSWVGGVLDSSSEAIMEDVDQDEDEPMNVDDDGMVEEDEEKELSTQSIYLILAKLNLKHIE